MFSRREPSEANGFQLVSAKLIASSFESLTGRPLLETVFGDEDVLCAQKLYNAPFAVVAHDTAEDPVFFYGNLTAQNLFELTWAKFVALPSRYSAEAPNRQERARLLERVTRDGFVDDYSGVRIASSGQRFSIEDAVVWNLIDSDGERRGQAAIFDRWQML